MAPLLIPIEIPSYLSRPISLSVRLFANMMAGHTMMKVFGGFVAALGVFGIAPMAVLVALTGFEILVAVLHRSEEHTSELPSLMRISYAVFCLKKKTNIR